MRIIAGDFRRRQLFSPPGMTTRPIPDRVKESFFSMLGTRIKDATVIDLFSGSGSFGLEAVSRGAKQVMLVERDRRIAQTLERNIALLGVQARTKLVVGDALGLSIVARAPRPVDLIFIDPPYDVIRQPGGEPWNRVRQQASALGQLLAQDGFLVLRTPWPFIFDAPEAAERRVQLKLLAQGKLKAGQVGEAMHIAGSNDSGFASRASAGSPMTRTGKPDARSGKRRNPSRGKGSGGRNDLRRGAEDLGLTPAGQRHAEYTQLPEVEPDGSGWLDPEQIARELQGTDLRTNIAGLGTENSASGGVDVPDDDELGPDELLAELTELAGAGDALPPKGKPLRGPAPRAARPIRKARTGAQEPAAAEPMMRSSDEDALLRELGLDPDRVRAAGGLSKVNSEGGEDHLDLLLAQAHRQANAEKHFASLEIEGMRGPETHIYGTTAVHWYMKRPPERR